MHKNAHLTKNPGVEEKTLAYAIMTAGYLGKMYLRGEGVKQDFTIAKIWFERGAEYNEKECLNGLGITYRDGLVDGTVDDKRAHNFFLAAAGQDFAEAQVNLGKHHYSMSTLTTASWYPTEAPSLILRP
jgi:SEL1 protein